MKFWRVRAWKRSRSSATDNGGATGRAGTPPIELSFDRLAPSGRNYDLSREAFELLAALRLADAHEAMFRAFRVHRLARDAGFPDTQEAAEALEIALVCCETCNAPPVPAATRHLVRTMVLDGLIHAIAIPDSDAIGGVESDASLCKRHPAPQ